MYYLATNYNEIVSSFNTSFMVVSNKCTIYNMTCHVMSCHIISYIVSYRIVSSRLVSYRIVSYPNVSHHTTPHITSHHITSHHITPHHITSHHITSHHITAQHSIAIHSIALWIPGMELLIIHYIQNADRMGNTAVFSVKGISYQSLVFVSYVVHFYSLRNKYRFCSTDLDSVAYVHRDGCWNAST